MNKLIAAKAEGDDNNAIEMTSKKLEELSIYVGDTVKVKGPGWRSTVGIAM